MQLQVWIGSADIYAPAGAALHCQAFDRWFLPSFWTWFQLQIQLLIRSRQRLSVALREALVKSTRNN